MAKQAPDSDVPSISGIKGTQSDGAENAYQSMHNEVYFSVHVPSPVVASDLATSLFDSPGQVASREWAGGNERSFKPYDGKYVETSGPKELDTRDTLIREQNRDILLMPDGAGSIIINHDGSFVLNLKGSQADSTVSQKDGVTTVDMPSGGGSVVMNQDGSYTLKLDGTGKGSTISQKDGVTTVEMQDGSTISFDKDGPKAIYRPNGNRSWARSLNELIIGAPENWQMNQGISGRLDR